MAEPAPMSIETERIQRLNQSDCDNRGRYVLYWMQQSQRAQFNPALEYAIGRANALEQGVVVGFGLTDDYPEANARHYQFMLEGLAESAAQLHDRGIKFVLRLGSPEQVALDLAETASLVVCDRGYLRHQRQWRAHVAAHAGREVTAVEADVVVPVETASDKAEHAARTLRPKLLRQRERFLTDLKPRTPAKSSLPLNVRGDHDARQPQAIMTCLHVDRTVQPVSRFRGGTTRAQELLTRFLRHGLAGYQDARNDPAAPQCSNLSPYLHFGQISPLEIALKVRRAKSGSRQDAEAFLEELIVRRELAVNFVYFERDYDKYKCLPSWARRTLAEHRQDERRYRYTRQQLESADTHDEYWNAAMTEMLATGYMHNYMRMYWGKKIIEWCNTPEYAYATALYLNNKYFLDGRDPSSYTNVGWLFGLHDRAWTERPIFGKTRYMNAAGLERKFDIAGYVRWTQGL